MYVYIFTAEMKAYISCYILYESTIAYYKCYDLVTQPTNEHFSQQHVSQTRTGGNSPEVPLSKNKSSKKGFF